METILDDLKEQTIPSGARGKLLADICVQSFILLLTLYFMATDQWVPAFISFYIGIGIYQVFSSLVQLALHKPNVLYRIYYIQLFVYALLVFYTFAFDNGITTKAIFYLSPFTALYYFIITIITFNQAKK